MQLACPVKSYFTGGCNVSALEDDRPKSKPNIGDCLSEMLTGLRRYASDLRGPFVTALYCEASKIRLVQKPLGRSDPSITMIYTHIFDEEAERALKSFRKTMAVVA